MKKILSLAFIFCAFATFTFAQEAQAEKKEVKKAKTSPAERAKASIERLNETLVAANPELKLTDEQRKELNQYYLSKYAPKINVMKGAEAKEGEVKAGQLPGADKKEKRAKKQTLYNILTKQQLSAMSTAKKKMREDKKKAREEAAKEKAAAEGKN